MNTFFKFAGELDMTGVLGEYFVHNFLDKSFAAINKVLNKKLDSKDKKNIKIHLENHHNFLINWTTHTSNFLLSSPQNIKTYNTEVLLTYDIKKFSLNSNNQTNTFSEIQLLESPNNFIILGDPGSGKTTTLKRLIYKILIENSIKRLETSLPLLVILRELKGNDSICKLIAKITGIPYEEKVIKEYDKKVYNSETKKYEDRYKDVLKIYSDFENNIELLDAVIYFLNNVKNIVFLDGLDELNFDMKEKILEEINDLAKSLNFNSKIIISCRTGDFHYSMENFHVCEIIPLTLEDSTKIVNSWLDDSSNFFSQLLDKPYRDLINRPLFLTQLLILYSRNNNELPANTSDVYRRIVSILLRDWDSDRRIIRKSKYSKFDSIKKESFLVDVAFNLTYIIKSKIFDDLIFTKIYLSLCKKYSLPKEEALQVAQELESHNGIIAKSYSSYFEFCHLSLQEYLCAEYLKTLPINSINIMEYFYEYPECLAITASLASEPSSWLCNFIMQVYKTSKKLNITEEQVSTSIHKFFYRLIYENPYFETSIELNIAILNIFFNHYKDEQINEIIIRFINNAKLTETFKSSLKEYYIVEQNINHVVIRKQRKTFTNLTDIDFPFDGKLAIKVLQEFQFLV